jgi:hypothetical protein
VLASETTVAPNVPTSLLRASPRASPAWSEKIAGPMLYIALWLARPVRAAMAPPGGDGSRLGRRGGSSSVTTVSWARGRKARGSRVGRLELHCALLLHPRSEGCRLSDLRFCRTSGVRSCPLLSVVHHSAADPARTEDPVGSGRGRLRRSGPPRPGTDRPAGHGKADPSGELDATRARR